MKKHWDTITRILDEGIVSKALQTHIQMRKDALPALEYLQLAIAINAVIPKRHRKKQE